MGQGVMYKCSKCHKSYNANWGVGFLFPQVYEKMMKDIKNGKYGAEWQKIVLSDETIAADAEEYIYVCRKCGNWGIEPGLSLYAANNQDAAQECTEERRWFSRGTGVFVAPYELGENYHILKCRIHQCSKCGSRMHKATVIEAYNLKCPHCGSEPDENTKREKIMWD